MTHRFDPEILQLIPHREPMLLINTLVELNAGYAETLVFVDEHAPFMTEQGVASWLGLEYMGQTSALIAGFQEREGLCAPHLGFLMGSRKYQSNAEYFTLNKTLRVCCQEGVLVGSSLANFKCTISLADNDQEVANASLSVFRRPMTDL